MQLVDSQIVGYIEVDLVNKQLTFYEHDTINGVRHIMYSFNDRNFN
jgi:hypothetical protein